MDGASPTRRIRSDKDDGTGDRLSCRDHELLQDPMDVDVRTEWVQWSYRELGVILAQYSQIEDGPRSFAPHCRVESAQGLVDELRFQSGRATPIDALTAAAPLKLEARSKTTSARSIEQRLANSRVRSTRSSARAVWPIDCPPIWHSR